MTPLLRPRLVGGLLERFLAELEPARWSVFVLAEVEGWMRVGACVIGCVGVVIALVHLTVTPGPRVEGAVPRVESLGFAANT